VAAAMEFMGAAADLLDDLQDGDTEWQIDAQSLHLLAALLSLPTLALLRLQRRNVGARKLVRVLQVFSHLTAQSGAGQFEDLQLENQSTVSLEKALEIAGLKSASLMQCCCQLGALVGSDDDELVSTYGRFGWHVGLFAQLLNDMRDVSCDGQAKSDLKRNKKTTPLVFALTAPGGDPRAERVQRLLSEASEGPLAENEVRQSLRDIGAIHFTWIMADVQRRLALGVLREIEAKGHRIEELAGLLD